MASFIVDRKKLASTYDAYAKHRRAVGKEHWKEKARETFLKILKGEGAHTLLEVGAGTGEDSLFFQNAGLKVRAIDLSPKHVEMMKVLGIDAEVKDFYDLNVNEGEFDAAYLMNSLVHVPKKDFTEVLEKIAKMVKPGGVIFIGQYGGEDFEGIRENDKYKPNRFFSFFLFDDIKRELNKVFDVIREQKIPLDNLEFHSFILRNKRTIK